MEPDAIENFEQEFGKHHKGVNVDYSESYSNKQRDEIRSAYFGHTNFSLFTACGYYRSNLGELSKVPMTIVSECSDHSRFAAFSCVSKVIENLEKIMSISMKVIYVWSHGYTSQFRSRFFLRFSYTCILINIWNDITTRPIMARGQYTELVVR